MKRIQGLYVIEKEGTPILVHERYTQGKVEAESVLVVNFITAFQLFLAELGDSKFYTIELKNSNIHSYYDKENDLYFIMKCECQSEFASGVLKNLRKLFFSKLSKEMISFQELDNGIKEDLRKSMEELIKPKANIETFLEVLKF
ncbi:MAG: hypothetical protein EU521_01340 [Promethearchaeota archaeon]|nr:MAG: hypothetical protein EU521_01340 [Candidatus Lokiarchaeota archaeon]